MWAMATATRKRAATIATVLALAGLGGVALETNHGIPSGAAATAGHASRAPIVTSTSGAGGAQTVAAVGPAPTTAAPHLVTAASGAPAGREEDD